MINRVKIEILGTAYTIASPESEEYVRRLAAEIDSQITGLVDSDPKLTPNAALVLCIMGYADSLKKSEDSADHMRAQITDYLEDAAKARAELDEARRELARLKKNQ